MTDRFVTTIELPWPPSKLSRNGSQAWREVDCKFLQENHGNMSIGELATAMGRSKAAIRGKVTRAGLAKKVLWSPEEEAALIALYENAGSSGVLSLTAFASSIGRDKANVSRKAKVLGLCTSQKRRKVEERKIRLPKFATAAERSEAQSKRARQYLKENGHPKGMLGKHHTEETKEGLRRTSAAYNKSLTVDERSALTMKALKAKVAIHGKLATNGGRGSWKAGWREFGGKRCYFRSRWEANYGRYLQWLKEQGQIIEWEHEPETFWFDAIKRGVRSYLPDFRVTENNGFIGLHEVKGWMDARSKTTLKRMAKYHPEQSITVIREKEYKELTRKVSALIEGWEP